MTKLYHTEESEPGLTDGLNYTGNKGPKFGARHAQILLMSAVSALSFATKSLMSVAIVAMTDNTTSSNPNVPTYDWNNTSVIVSAILWSGIAINLLAGYLGKQYGPKWFIVISTLLNSVFFLLIPLSAKLGGSTGVIVCRIFQGLALGFLSPLGTVVGGRWISPEERSRLGFVGAGVATVTVMITYVASGYIAASSWGWPWIFYIFGGINVVCSLVYALFGAQSPADHKRISPEERKFLEVTLFEKKDNGQTPWRKIFTSMPFWAIVVAQSGSEWIIVMLSTEISIFLAKVMQYDMKSNATLSAAPSLIGIVSGVFLAIISDILPKKGIVSIVNSRRIFHLTGMIGMSLVLIFMTWIPVEYRAWTIVLLCFGNIFILASSVGGPGTNILDVSPKYAGIIGGFSSTLSQCVSLFAPLTVQWICTDQTDASQWRITFIISAAVAILTAVFFAVFATDKRQDWATDSDWEADIEVKKRKSSIISTAAGIGA